MSLNVENFRYYATVSGYGITRYLNQCERIPGCEDRFFFSTAIKISSETEITKDVVCIPKHLEDTLRHAVYRRTLPLTPLEQTQVKKLNYYVLDPYTISRHGTESDPLEGAVFIKVRGLTGLYNFCNGVKGVP